MGKNVTPYAFMNDSQRRRLLLASALAGGLTVSGPVLADVPPASTPIGSPQQISERLMADAQKALTSGNGRLAMIDLKNALAADPRNIKARVLLGSILKRANDTSGAERELRQARKDGGAPGLVLPELFDVMLVRGEYQLILSEFPDPGVGGPEAPIVLMARAMAFQNLNRPAEAKDASDRALAIRRDVPSLLVRARLAMMQGQLAEAGKFADEAIPKATTAEPMLYKAGLLLAGGQAQAALDLSNQILEKYPGNIQGRFARIEAYFGLKQDEKAKAEIDDILTKNPGNLMGVYYRAQVLARAGNVNESWRLAQGLPGEFRDSQPRVALVIADIAAKAGSEETAASILNRILLTQPNSIPARTRLASFRLKENNAEEALKVLGPIKDSPDFQVQGLLSNTYIRLHRNEDALAVLRKLDAGGTTDPQIKRNIALLEIDAGQTEQGIRSLAQLNAKYPTDLDLARPLIMALLQAKRYSEALAVADRLGADRKQSARALVLRGGILLAQKNLAGAQTAFDRAVAADPKNTEALFSRSDYLASVQKFGQASSDLQAVLALDPKNLGAFLKLADIAARQDRDRDVRSLLSRAIGAAPQSPAPRLALVRYLLSRRDFKNALPAATEFARVQPSNTDAVTLLGDAQFASGQKKEAVATYRRLAALAPAAAAPQVQLGVALSATGDRLGAANAMDAAAKRAPNSADVRTAQIQLLLNQGNNDAALAAARAFQSANPGTDADLLLSATLDSVKQHDQALAVLNKSFADKPTNVLLLKLTAFALQAKDKERAANLMSKWVADHPDDLPVRMEYASFLMQQGDNARAIPQYESALKQSPDNPIVLNNLGWLIQASNPKRAIVMLTRAWELAPASADIADTLGWLKFQQKDAAGGLSLLNRAHELKPKDGEITYHLVLALDANAKRDAARGLLKGLLAGGTQFKDRPAAEQLSAAWR